MGGLNRVLYRVPQKIRLGQWQGRPTAFFGWCDVSTWQETDCWDRSRRPSAGFLSSHILGHLLGYVSKCGDPCGVVVFPFKSSNLPEKGTNSKQHIHKHAVPIMGMEQLGQASPQFSLQVARAHPHWFCFLGEAGAFRKPRPVTPIKRKPTPGLFAEGMKNRARPVIKDQYLSRG